MLIGTGVTVHQPVASRSTIPRVSGDGSNFPRQTGAPALHRFNPAGSTTMKTPTFGRWSAVTIVLGFALVVALSLSAKADETTAAPPAVPQPLTAARIGEQALAKASEALGDAVSKAGTELSKSWEAWKTAASLKVAEATAAAEAEAAAVVAAAYRTKVAEMETATAAVETATKVAVKLLETTPPKGVVAK